MKLRLSGKPNNIIKYWIPKIQYAVLVALILSWSCNVRAEHVRIVRVYDGDTVTATGQGGEFKIRLVGIDAPETSKAKRDPGQPFSIQSKKLLAKLTFKKDVQLTSFGVDRYGRVLGLIAIDGRNVNLEMVAQGLAEVYRGRPPKGFDNSLFIEAELKARKAHLGIWQQGSGYVSPKTWRQDRRSTNY